MFDKELYRGIRSILRKRQDLKKPRYRDGESPMTGHCYVASEAYYHSVVDEVPSNKIDVYHVSHEGTTHWFLESDGEVIDLTKEQFDETPPYDEATCGFFMTSEPSERAREVLDELDS